MNTDNEDKQDKNPRPLALTPEERRNFVGAFAWLIRQDKKQNPELYQSSNLQITTNSQII